MATKYTLYFSDTSKTPFDLQSYTKNGPESPSDPSIIQGATTASTTLKLWGKGNKEYGEPVFQDLIYMLENFANSSAPVFAIEGQLWYDNSGGSPSPLPKLKMYDGAAWPAIITANGSSVMAAELILSGNLTISSDINAAVPKQYVDAHIALADVHLTAPQNTFLDALDLPTLTGFDVNSLIGIGSPVQTQFDNIQIQFGTLTSPVQTQFDNIQIQFGNLGSPVQTQFDNIQIQFTNVDTSLAEKVSRISNTTMALNINTTFDGGEILGLPDVPTVQNAAASGKYVDDQIATVSGGFGDVVSRVSNTTMAANINTTFDGGEILGLPDEPTVLDAAVSNRYFQDQLALGVGGDGVLSTTVWSNDVGDGSPPVVISENTLELTVSYPASPDITFRAGGIARTGHLHDAVDITIDNAFNIDYGINVQTAIEKAEEEIELLKTGGAPPSATITVQRIFEILTTPLTVAGSPISVFGIQNHNVDDNRITLTVNGVKQYTHTRGTQSIDYDIIISDAQFTGLDNTQTYDFDIAVDGGTATTISIAAVSSPLVDISTHGGLVTAINDQLSALSIDTEFAISTGVTETFTTYLSGSASSILITDPGGSPSIYLFGVDGSPSTIIAATFLSNPFIGGSPGAVPDDITIAGNVLSSFPIGKTFTIRGSVEATYGTYDGVYSVHADGAVFDTTNTIIPIALVENSIINTPLLPNYDPGAGSPNPTPAPSPFGNVHLSPLGGIVQVADAANGLEGDYMETDLVGNPVPLSGFSSNVVFNYDIITGSKIESLLYV